MQQGRADAGSTTARPDTASGHGHDKRSRHAVTVDAARMVDRDRALPTRRLLTVIKKNYDDDYDDDDYCNYYYFYHHHHRHHHHHHRHHHHIITVYV